MVIPSVFEISSLVHYQGQGIDRLPGRDDQSGENPSLHVVAVGFQNKGKG